MTPQQPAPGRRRVVVRRAGAIATAVALVGATTAVVLADEALPAPGAQAVPAPEFDVPATAAALVCAGEPTLAAGDGMSVDPDLEPQDVEPDTVLRALSLPGADGEPAPATYATLGESDGVDLRYTGHVRLLRAPITEAGMLRAEPEGETPPSATGVTVARTEAGDLRGLVATPCVAPTTTTWLVGGSTETGSSTELVLTNLGQTPATVDVSAWGSAGALDSARATGLLVPAMSQERVLVEAALTTDPRLALRVTASGGQIAATMQTHQMDGLVPAGISAVSPSAPPATEVTVPGVVLPARGGDASALRLVNPGTETAEVNLALLGPDGRVTVPGAEEVVVDAGAVYDISLAGLEPGSYAVHLTSDVPVTAGAVLTRAGQAGELDPGTDPVDRAWAPAARLMSSGVLTAPGNRVDDAVLTLSNPSGQSLSVSVRPFSEQAGQQEFLIEVPARSTVRQRLDRLGEDVLALRVAVVDHEAPGVAAALVMTSDAADGRLIAVLPAQEDAQDAGSVPVTVR